MEIKGTSPNKPHEKIKPTAKQDGDQTIRDIFSYSESDLSPEGKLTLIIQGGEKTTVRKVKEQCKKCGIGKCKEDLEIIGGFTFEIDPEDLPRLLKILPEDVEISIDRKVKFFGSR